MKRYNVEIGYGVGDPYCECIENGSGDWVRHEDAIARIAELEAENAKLRNVMATWQAQRDEARRLVKSIALAASEEWVATELPSLSNEFCLAIDNCNEAVKRWEVRGE
jgi:hypothetical protein